MARLYQSGAADYIIIGLWSQADTKLLKSNPTIAAGDFKIWNPNTSTYDNLATPPAALSAAGPAVRIDWNATEAAYVPFYIVWHDAVGAEWCDGDLSIRMGIRDTDDLATGADVPTAAQNAGAVGARVVEGTLTQDEITRIILAVEAGKAAGGGTTTITFRDQADTKDRVTATVDENGNRTAITVDGA
jgi:hypothetical protein